jgi:hypothetical protein
MIGLFEIMGNVIKLPISKIRQMYVANEGGM